MSQGQFVNDVVGLDTKGGEEWGPAMHVFGSATFRRCPLSWILASRQRVHPKEHFPPALPTLPHWQNISFYHLLRLAQDERSLPGLRSQFLSRGRILSRRHVLQLRAGLGCDRHICGGSLGPDHLAPGEDSNLGISTFPAFCARDHTLFASPLDLPGSGDRSGNKKALSLMLVWTTRNDGPLQAGNAVEFAPLPFAIPPRKSAQKWGTRPALDQLRRRIHRAEFGSHPALFLFDLLGQFAKLFG